MSVSKFGSSTDSETASSTNVGTSKGLTISQIANSFLQKKQRY
jgi:hypothetical protein